MHETRCDSCDVLFTMVPSHISQWQQRLYTPSSDSSDSTVTFPIMRGQEEYVDVVSQHPVINHCMVLVSLGWQLCCLTIPPGGRIITAQLDCSQPGREAFCPTIPASQQ